jgi:hypothetical protein
MKRSIVAAATAALLLASLASRASGGEPGSELLPNLQVRGTPFVTSEWESGNRWLRFNTEVANRGVGPLELQARNKPCAGDTQRFRTFQNVFTDSEGDGVFTRGDDTDFVNERTGCIIFHPAHNHWHFEDFARYELLQIRPDGYLKKTAVADADKVSFCMTDTSSLGEPILGTAPQRWYKAIPEGCLQNEDETFDPMGISVGWYDLYGYTLAGQELVITDLPEGPYCLRIRLDPTDRLREIQEKDNGHRIRLKIDDEGVEVRATVPCKSE